MYNFFSVNSDCDFLYCTFSAGFLCYVIQWNRQWLVAAASMHAINVIFCVFRLLLLLNGVIPPISQNSILFWIVLKCSYSLYICILRSGSLLSMFSVCVPFHLSSPSSPFEFLFFCAANWVDSRCSVICLNFSWVFAFRILLNCNFHLALLIRVLLID